MTPEERRRPELIKGSRRLRIAKGSGTNVQAVNQLVKQFGQMRKVMKQIGRGKMPDLAGASCARPANLPRRLLRRYRQRTSRAPRGSSTRLTRVGGKKDPVWRIVVADQRSPRDGRNIEIVGQYNAQTEPSTIKLDEERVRELARQGRPAHRHRSASSCARRASTSAAPSAPARCASCSSTWPASSSTSPTRWPSSSSRRTTARSSSSCRSPTTTTARVIGKGGRTANALRTVVKAAAVKEQRRVLVDIVD